MSTDFLASMARMSRQRVDAARAHCPTEVLRERARNAPPAPRLRRHELGFDLIAEVKHRSPAAGALTPAGDSIGGRVAQYARAGAAAVSVLTEPERFDGSLAHLTEAAHALAPHGVPALRKDFLVDGYQLLEARASGAGGVLLIVRMLESRELEELIAQASELGLFVLLEAFDERDIERMHELLQLRASRSCDVLAGLNSRDLASLAVVPERFEQLAHLLPPDVPRVAESGVDTPADARRVAELGYELALVGSALMRSADPATLARRMLEAGRGVRGQREPSRCG